MHRPLNRSELKSLWDELKNMGYPALDKIFMEPRYFMRNQTCFPGDVIKLGEEVFEIKEMYPYFDLILLYSPDDQTHYTEGFSDIEVLEKKSVWHKLRENAAINFVFIRGVSHESSF